MTAGTAAAVLFDMDGLLVDSEPVWYEVEYAVVERLGGGWNKAHQAACIGGTIDASCRYIIELTGASVSVEELTDMLLSDMIGHFRSSLPLHAGALDLLRAVHATGTPTGLVSSSYRVLVDAALASIDTHQFDVTVAGDEITNGKPHPEPYLTACARLGVDPAEVVVLEDAITGVMSAEAAGCTVVAVPSVAPIDESARRPVVNALADIDPGWLLSLPASFGGYGLEHVEA